MEQEIAGRFPRAQLVLDERYCVRAGDMRNRQRHVSAAMMVGRNGEAESMRRIQRFGEVSAVHFQMVAGPVVHSSGAAMEPETGQVENVVLAEEVDLVVEEVADERRVLDVEPSGAGKGDLADTPRRKRNRSARGHRP